MSDIDNNLIFFDNDGNLTKFDGKIYKKLDGKWPKKTWMQQRLNKIRSNPLYANLNSNVIKEGESDERD